MKIGVGFSLVLFLAVCLGGCVHATGPCYGVGCHAFAPSPGGQSRATAADTGKNAGQTRSLLKKLKL